MLVGAFALMTVLITTDTVLAASRVVVSQVQTGDAVSASNEVIEIYNQADTDADVSGWCVKYSAASTALPSASSKYCFTPADTVTKLYLAPKSYATIVSSMYPTNADFTPDGKFSAGLTATGGHVWLIDSSAASIDSVGWGTALYPEGSIVGVTPVPSAPAPTSSQVLLRKSLPSGERQDTGSSKTDFEMGVLKFRTSGLFEVRTPIDICATVTGIQETLPAGYGYDEAGNCELLAADVCSNLHLIQTVPPAGTMPDSTGACVVDACVNIAGLQATLPHGYSAEGGACRALEDRVIALSEVLPNVTGTDTGHEYIELYNPNNRSVLLDGYVIQIGKTYEKSYHLSTLTGTTSIEAGGYVVLRDGDLGFTLLNTTSGLRVVSPAGNIVSETTYSDPSDDESWALIAGTWQYTNRPTPGMANMIATDTDDSGTLGVATTVLTPCQAGKYRHPLTNRCRNIESDASVLAACDSDEYRNPDTNRCRKIVTTAAGLTACSDGYERNTVTNRCRKITSATSSLTPCKDGYERNPTTNRCRKSVALTDPVTTVAQAPADETASLTAKSALIATAGIGAVGYGLFEWRSELLVGLRRLIGLAGLLAGK